MRILFIGIKNMAKNKYFQISTAIDYPSGKFHLGHAYEKICTDVLARWKRLQGFKVHFSTGTDCHGLKIQRAAKKVGKTPEQFVNEISEDFKELSKKLNISYEDFIMTIEERHKKVIVQVLKDLEKKGYIYKGKYEGLYCVDCETYYTEKDLVGGNCPIHKKKIEKIKEESYFFKLSKFQDELIYLLKKKDFLWPKKKRNEVLSRLKEPLKDLSISRKKVEWGIPLPFEKDMTIFVWVEALVNYLSTVDYPNEKFKNFWPATHIIGSDIVWHHTVIWFSILSALDLEIPKVIVHGFINLKGEKLSKARGVNVDPLELAEKYGIDSLRYFLMRNIPFGDDGDFSEEALVDRHNNELADKLGNLVSRVSTLVEKYGYEETRDQHLSPKWKKALKNDKVKYEEIITNINSDRDVIRLLKMKEEKGLDALLLSYPQLMTEVTQVFVKRYMESFQFDKALNIIFALIDTCNEFLQLRKPWESSKSIKYKKWVLGETVRTIRKISELLLPFIPESAEKIQKQFKAKNIKKGEILFKKIPTK